jgi:hypothetical protein
MPHNNETTPVNKHNGGIFCYFVNKKIKNNEGLFNTLTNYPVK